MVGARASRRPFDFTLSTKAFLHSWVQSLRFQLRETSVELLELLPPYVQTALSGTAQATDPNAMPLADYIAEVTQVLSEPNVSHDEILVKRVKALRWAERNNDYEQEFKALNEGAFSTPPRRREELIAFAN